jgi:hypothetical protein
MIVAMPALIITPPPMVVIMVFVDATASRAEQANAKAQQAGQNQDFTQHRVSFAQ